MFCKHCGKPLSGGAKFCGACGQAVERPSVAAHPAPEKSERLRPAVSEPQPASAPPAKAAPRPAQSAPPPTGQRARVANAPQPQKKQGCLPTCLLVGGCATVLVLAFAVILIAFDIFAPFDDKPLVRSTPASPIFETTGQNVDDAEDYTPRAPQSPADEVETARVITADSPVSLTLDDRTRLELPASAVPIEVTLTREGGGVSLGQPGLETSGSVRSLEFDLSLADESFVPRLTIPASELGDLHPATVNIARVGPVWVNGEIVEDQIVYLPLQLDEQGDIQITDTYTAGLAGAASVSSGRSQTRLVSYSAQFGSGNWTKVRYVPMTFQGDLDWQIHPRLMRMIPDPEAADSGWRRPADLKKDREWLNKPITNIIFLVHGHNEQEWDGTARATTAEPWNYLYKREVWDTFYETFLAETDPDQIACTAIYEFIYPTYRPAYSPIQGEIVPTLGESFSNAMRNGARNDGYRIRAIREAGMPVNIFIAAHSMGGLVARAGIRQTDVDAYWHESFRRLVTWGTPHRGSPLVSLGYLLRGKYVVNPGQLVANAAWYRADAEFAANLALGNDVTRYILNTAVQLDTPGTRDLRWDNEVPLRLDEIFSADTKGFYLRDPGGTEYDLTSGSWLYNDNLRKFNQSDPYYQSGKYTFLYGVTSKRFPDSSGGTAIGAALIPVLMKDAQKGGSDGAVPEVSMTGRGITGEPPEPDLGDIDHEEYFENSSKGRATSMATFEAFGLREPRCACAEVVISNVDEAEGTREIDARLIMDAELSPFPGEKIESAESLLVIDEAQKLYTPLSELRFTNSGELNGSISLPDDVGEEARLAVRVVLRDGSELISDSLALDETVCSIPWAAFSICHCENGEKCYYNGKEAICGGPEPPREWYCEGSR